MSAIGWNWYHSIYIIYLELVKYNTSQLVSHVWKWFDTIQLVLHVGNWLKLTPFNWYQISGTGRIWYHSISITYMELVKTDTKLISNMWNWVNMVLFNWYQMSGTDGHITIQLVPNFWNWLNSIVIECQEFVLYDTIQLLSLIWNWLNLISFNWYQMSWTD